MGFYDELAKYYDYIFKPSEKQISFLQSSIGLPPKDILDIACGTGSYAIQLSKLGYKLTGIDLDEKMIANAIEKANNENLEIELSVQNMLAFETNRTYDLIYCIGNSLVHLSSITEITIFLNHIKRRLKPNGKIVIQIINYDRILSQKINHLPTIYNEEKQLSFSRFYHYQKDINKVIFRTELKVNNQETQNTINLLPLLSSELRNCLLNSGYQNIHMYGDFSFSDYVNDESYALVLTATY